MITDELITYIRTEEARGVPRDTIRANLMSAGGWELKNIDEAFAHVSPVPAAMSASFIPSSPVASEPVTHPAPVVSVPAPVATSVVSVPHSRGIRLTLIILIPILALVLGAGSVYAFVPAVRDTLTFAFATPQERVFLAAHKFAAAPSYTFTSRSVTSIVAPEGASPSDSPLVKLVLSAGTQTADLTGSVRQTPDSSSSVAREILASVSLAGDASSTPSMKADVYANTGTNTFALRINAPEAFIIFDLKPILGRWIDFSPASLDAAQGSLLLDPGDAKSLTTLTKSYKESLGYIISKAPTYLTVSDAGVGDAIQGEPTTVYDLAVDLAALHTAIEESTFFTSLDAAGQAQFKQSFDSAISATGQVWIGSRSHYPLRMTIITHDKLNTLKEFEGYERVMTQDITYSGFGKSVEITAPDSMLSIKDAMTAILPKVNSLFKR